MRYLVEVVDQDGSRRKLYFVDAVCNVDALEITLKHIHCDRKIVLVDDLTEKVDDHTYIYLEEAQLKLYPIENIPRLYRSTVTS